LFSPALQPATANLPPVAAFFNGAEISNVTLSPKGGYVASTMAPAMAPRHW
jgi:hypothetical protein